MNFKVLISAILASLIAVAGCSSDDNGGGATGGDAGTGGMGGDGGSTPPATVDCDDLPAVDAYAVGDVFDNVPVTSSDDCTDPVFALGADAASRLNTRIENADPGDVICLEAGTYEMDGTINVSLVGELTIKGIGDSPDDTILKFGGLGSGIGIFVQKDDVTVENLWVKNSGANGIEQDGTSGSVFRKVHVTWDDFCVGPDARDNCGEACDCEGPFAPDNCGESCDCEGPFAPANCGQVCEENADCSDVRLACDSGACVPNDATYCEDARLACAAGSCGPSKDTYCDDPALTCGGGDGTCVGDQGKNGAYGVYPTNCEDTLVEFSQVTDASDAGIYIGKCGWLDDTTTGGIVQYNIAANNVAGLEVENCLDVIAHDNLVLGNTGGLMPLQQPISPDRPANTGVLMEDNMVWCNNGENFAETGVVQIIPVGTGVLNLGGQGVEIRNNDIQGNDSLGMALVSSSFTCDAAGADCPPYAYEYNPYAEDIYAHDNYFLNNGTNADMDNPFSIIFLLTGTGTPENPTEDVFWDGNIMPGNDDPGICLGTNFAGTYRDLTQNQCQMPANVGAFAQCIIDNTTTDTTGRLCAP